MSEEDNPHFLKGHALDLKQIRLDLYRLACYFEASRHLVGRETNGNASEDEYIPDLPKEFFKDEVSRVLLQSAIVLRILDDESEANRDERNPFICGTLELDGGSEPLGLREACNKILHARRMNYDKCSSEQRTPRDGRHDWYRPYLYLYGVQARKHWRAALDVRAFINHGARLLRARTLSEFIEWNEKYDGA